MSPTDLAPPRIAGYEYRDLLARGGHSVVLLYHQRDLGRDVAVKVLTLQGARQGTSARVVAEANLMARLGLHANIVPVFFSAEDEGRPYLVMAYCPGQDLWTLLKEHGPFDARRVLRIGAQIAGALDAAHRLGIIHRDLKPANILTDEYRNPRLTDFGISVLDDDPADGIAASVPWAPAEVLAGRPGEVTADLYSLGATLWNLLTARMPFDRPGDNSPDAMEARIRAGGAPPTGRADVPPALEDLLGRLLAREPERRPATAAAVVAELERIEAACGGPVRAEDPWYVTAELGATVHRDAPAKVYDEALLTKTRLRPQWTHEQLRTQRRDSRPEPVAKPVTRRWWWLAVPVVAAAAITTAVLLNHSDPQPKPSTGTAQGEQDAGAGGDLVPPGVPTVTGTRTDPKHARFTWTYSAPYDSDTFLWRTATDNGTAAGPAIDVPATGETCLQVKVIRADGANGSVEWSPKACIQ